MIGFVIALKSESKYFLEKVINLTLMVDDLKGIVTDIFYFVF